MTIAISDKVEIGPGIKEGAHYADFVLVGRATCGTLLMIPPGRAFGQFRMPIPQDFYDALYRENTGNKEIKFKITIETL